MAFAILTEIVGVVKTINLTPASLTQGHFTLRRWKLATKSIAEEERPAKVRRAAAILGWDWRRRSARTRLRQAAITWGAAPERTVEWSSANVTSRTWCRRFSMPQCPRIRVR